MKLTKSQLEQIIREESLNFNSTSLLEGWFGADTEKESEIDVTAYRLMNQLINHTRDQNVRMDQMKQRIEELEVQMSEISSQIDVPGMKASEEDLTRNISMPKDIEDLIREELKKRFVTFLED